MAEVGEVKVPVQVLAEAVVVELATLEVKYGEVLLARLPCSDPETYQAVFEAIRGTLRYQGTEPPPLLVFGNEIDFSTLELPHDAMDQLVDQVADRLIERLKQRAEVEAQLAEDLRNPNRHVQTGGLVEELKRLRVPPEADAPPTFQAPPGHPLHGWPPNPAPEISPGDMD